MVQGRKWIEIYVEGVSWQPGHHLFATLSALITQRNPINEAKTEEMIRARNNKKSFLLLNMLVEYE